MNERKRNFAMLGGLAGLVYMTANRLLPGLSDFLLGIVLGLGILFFTAALLPEKTARKIRKWKRRGE